MISSARIGEICDLPLDSWSPATKSTIFQALEELKDIAIWAAQNTIRFEELEAGKEGPCGFSIWAHYLEKSKLPIGRRSRVLARKKILYSMMGRDRIDALRALYQEVKEGRGQEAKED